MRETCARSGTAALCQSNNKLQLRAGSAHLDDLERSVYYESLPLATRYQTNLALWQPPPSPKTTKCGESRLQSALEWRSHLTHVDLHIVSIARQPARADLQIRALHAGRVDRARRRVHRRVERQAVDARDGDVRARRRGGALQAREQVVRDGAGDVRPGDVREPEGRAVAVPRLAVE